MIEKNGMSIVYNQVILRSKNMLKKNTDLKPIKDQTIEDKMYVLKKVTHQILGPKWRFYSKMKQAGRRLLLGENSSFSEHLKATQSALRYTTKSARDSYYTIYQSCIENICRYTSYEKTDFPELPTTQTGQEIPSLTAEQDAIIITWTPIKFMLPIKRIQQKGMATQRHSEKLSAKLVFKVVAYYAIPENWDIDKLTFYVKRLSPESTQQEVHEALNPLLEDLQVLLTALGLLDLYQSSLTEERSELEASFDEKLGLNSVESQILTLYWYDFIYEALEMFIFRYTLILITGTNSPMAIHRLAVLLEPILEKAIESRSLFMGSFETDNNKKHLRKDYELHKTKMRDQAQTNKIKTPKGEFETFSYNSNLLEKSCLKFDIDKKPKIESEWGRFIKHSILGMDPGSNINKEAEDKSPEDSPSTETREHAMMQIMSTMAKSIQFKRTARYKILENFKRQIVSEVKVTTQRIKKKNEHCATKTKQLENNIKALTNDGNEKVEAFKQDLADFKYELAHLKKNTRLQCDKIKLDMRTSLNNQKVRLKELFKELSKMNSMNAGIAANVIYRLTAEIDEDGDFSRDFIRFVINSIQNDYSANLAPFYEHAFDILEPSTFEKVAIIQSFKKRGVEEAFGLTLNKEEVQQFKELVKNVKLKITKKHPDIFQSSIVYASMIVPMENVLNMSIDNESLSMLLKLKVVTPKKSKAHHLPPAVTKLVLFLNTLQNSVPKHNLILEGKNSEKDPYNAINVTTLKSLAKI